MKASCDTCGQPHPRNGHKGGNPHGLARAPGRTEITDWGLGDTTVDPGETLLRLLTQVVLRAERYAAEIGAMSTSTACRKP